MREDERKWPHHVKYSSQRSLINTDTKTESGDMCVSPCDTTITKAGQRRLAGSVSAGRTCTADFIKGQSEHEHRPLPATLIHRQKEPRSDCGISYGDSRGHVMSCTCPVQIHCHCIACMIINGQCVLWRIIELSQLVNKNYFTTWWLNVQNVWWPGRDFGMMVYWATQMFSF